MVKNKKYNRKYKDSFLLYDYLNMYEHQSTLNPNMPLRDLFYIAYEYEKLVDGKQIYGSRAIRIPAPRFIMFYNGCEKAEKSTLLKLSDLYSVPQEEPELELKVKIININYGYNKLGYLTEEITRITGIPVNRIDKLH